MNAIVDAIGRQAALRLAGIVGGRTLRIPTLSPHPDSARARARLVRLIGADLAADLVTALPGARVYVARGPSLHNSRMRPIDLRRVDRLTKAGRSARYIADRLGCTERTVYAKRAILAQRRKT